MLTEIKVKNLKPLDKMKRYYDGAGLYLQVEKNGAKYWRFKYRLDGKEKVLALGVYPEVSLKTARLRRDKARFKLQEGEALIEQKKEVNLFKDVAEDWFAYKQQSWSGNTPKSRRIRLDRYLLPAFGKKPMDEIKPNDIYLFTQSILKTGSTETALRVQQIIGQIYNYAIARGFVEYNPAASLRQLMPIYKHNNLACIPIEEAGQLFNDIWFNFYRLYHQTQYGLWLLALTMVRTAELRFATWQEIDFEKKQWIIPAERMKMRRLHVVPLSSQVLQCLHAIKQHNWHGDLILPSPNKPRQPCSENIFLQALKKLGYGGRMTGHGFRSLAKTTLIEKLGFDDHLTERQLAHLIGNTVQQAYDRADFIEQRTVMMQAWGDYCEVLLKMTPPLLSVQ